jgi:hypothetical protein
MPFSENSSFNACSGAFADDIPENKLSDLGKLQLF